MSIADIKKNAEQKMLKSIESFKNELSKFRTGRAHPGILDQVQVEYYGSMVPISQVANVVLMDARTISVQPWEKGLGAKIEKAIRESDLGLNPADIAAFKLGVKLSQAGLAEFTMTPITVAVPEPTSLAMMVAGLVALAGLRRCVG